MSDPTAEPFTPGLARPFLTDPLLTDSLLTDSLLTDSLLTRLLNGGVLMHHAGWP